MIEAGKGIEELMAPDLLRWKVRAFGNMAYYLAEAGEKQRAAEAYRCATVAMARAEEYLALGAKDAQALYRDQLDNRGYVKIVFGEDAAAIEDGLKDCEDARRMGSDLRMFKSHTDHAVARISALRNRA
jgi:hypothetical protein